MGIGKRGKIVAVTWACLIALSPLADEPLFVPKTCGPYVHMIESAIVDELIANTPISVAHQYGVESAGKVTLTVHILVAPFHPAKEGFSTHVIYLVPGYGYVIRQASIYPKQGLAVFWLGYSPHGPGTDTGFNCTHSHSNCKVEDIPFGDLRRAFCSWWPVTTMAVVGDPIALKVATERNTKRAVLIQQGMVGQ